VPDREVPWHYLRPNPRTTTPRRVVTFDTEAWVRPDPHGTVQTFRLGVAAFDRRRTDHGHAPGTEWADVDDPTELWRWVHDRTATRETLWVYAHNLDYDLQLSSGIPELNRLGYEVKAFGGEAGATWFRLANGSRRLVLADLRSWLPLPLAEVGRAVGLQKGQLPPWRAGRQRWATYCRRDVEILRAAVLRLLEWWAVEDMGHWPLTGPAGAMAAFRHRHLATRLLVHRDPEVLELEREAYHCGRAEVNRHGLQEQGPYIDHDLVSAYAMIAGAVQLPRRLAGVRKDLSVEDWRRLEARTCTVSRVQVTTEEPVVPARTEHGTCWPVGTFRTALCGPEVELALEVGAQVQLLETALYHRGPILQGWAEWVLGALHGPHAVTDPLAHRVIKTWSRALIGKFGQRGFRMELVGEAPTERWVAGEYLDLEDGRRGSTYQLGHQLYIRTADGEGANSLPAISAYVASHLRATLTRTLRALPADGWVYADTDGILVTPAGEAAMAGITAHGSPGSWSPKGTYRRVLALGVQDLVLDGRPHIHGVPRSAVETEPRSWSYVQWPGLSWHLRRALVGRFTTRQVVHHLQAPYSRGWLCSCGGVHPLRLQLVDGANVVLPWSRSGHARKGHAPADRRQLRALPAA